MIMFLSGYSGTSYRTVAVTGKEVLLGLDGEISANNQMVT